MLAADQDQETQSQPSGATKSLASHLQSVLQEAERAAKAIIEDAEAEAARKIEASEQKAEGILLERAREMSAVSDALIERANHVRDRADELLEAFDEAIEDQQGPVHEFGRRAETTPAAAIQEAPAEPVEAPEEPVAEEPEPEEEASAGRAQKILSTLRGTGDSDAEPVAPPEEVSEIPAVTQPEAAPTSEIPSEGARLLATQMVVAGSSREAIETRLREHFGIENASDLLDDLLGSKSP